MRILKYLITFIFLAFIFSCKKYGHGYVKGTVYETGTESTIQGATVIMKYWKRPCKSCDVAYMYDSTITDSEGKFILYYDKKINHFYHIVVRDKNHFLGGMREVIDHKKKDLVFHLDPFAYLKIRLNKTSNSNNSCSCYDHDQNISYYHHDGSPVDTLFSHVTRVMGNRTFGLVWTIHYYPVIPYSKEYTNYSDNNVYVNKGDTLTYLITYN